MRPIVQASVAHAQFETIHPFADGNGRTGRALIYAVLRRRGAFRAGNVSEWCELFAEETARAATGAERLADEIESLEEEWLGRVGEPRKDSAARLLIAAPPELLDLVEDFERSIATAAQIRCGSLGLITPEELKEQRRPQI